MRLKTTPMDMRPAEIRIAMIQHGVYQASIARALGVTQSAVWQVIEGFCVSHRIRQKIAQAIGIDVKRIWPSTYLCEKPKRGRPRCKDMLAA